MRTHLKAGRRIAAIISELNYAVTRLTELRMTTELGHGDRAPDTYAEFLLRTSVTSVHEPPARTKPAISAEDRCCAEE
jgi:hypothetical protein